MTINIATRFKLLAYIATFFKKITNISVILLSILVFHVYYKVQVEVNIHTKENNKRKIYPST